MLADATWDAIHRWVAGRFDRAPAEMRAEGVRVQAPGPALDGYRGVYTWLMGQTAIVSAPTEMVDAVRRAVAGQPLTALTDAALWRTALGHDVERIVGPSYQGFLDSSAFRLAQAIPGVRPLTAADQPALRRFIAACPADDWRDSAIALDHLGQEPLVGLERDGALVALASAPMDGPASVAMRSVGVVTLPAARGMGAGLAVVSALAKRCLASGAPLHYQTLRANLPSVAIARRLGFEDVATALAVRLIPLTPQ
jgi:L-amino acid N-acyltransferase YncA